MSYEISRRPERYYAPRNTTQHRIELTAESPLGSIDMDNVVTPTGVCRGSEGGLRPGIGILLHDLGLDRTVRIMGKFSLANDVCDSAMIAETPLAVEWEGGGTRGKGPGTAKIMPEAVLGVPADDVDQYGLIHYNTRLMDMAERPHLHPVVAFERDQRGNMLGVTLLHAVSGLEGVTLSYATLNPQLHIVE